MQELRRGPELLEPGRDEPRDVRVYPLHGLERQEVPHAGRDVHVRRGIRGPKHRGVALATGIEPGAASLIEEAGRTNDTNMPHTNPNATLTMIRGAL